MGFFDSIKEKVQEHFEQKRADQRRIDEMRKEAQMNAQVTFEQEYKEQARLVAIAKAKRDAAKLSGRQGMVAKNRAMRLQEQGNGPGTFFDKMRDFTQKNLARREENMKRTEEMRKQASQIQEQRKGNIAQRQNQSPMNRPKAFGQSSWRM